MKKYMIFATLLVAFWTFQSCEDHNSVGSSIIPDGDAIKVDSFIFNEFVTNIVKDDTLYTGFRSRLYLGNSNKPNLGNATSKIYTEFSLKDTVLAGTNSLDSAVVYLKPSSYAGNADFIQTFDVYTIQDSIPSDANVLIDYSIPTEQKISSITAKYSTDSITVSDVKQAFHLRGRVNSTFATNLFNKLTGVKTTHALQEKLKGIKIQPINTTGEGLYAIDPSTSSSPLSGIIFYYKNNNEAKTLQLRMSPVIDITTETSYAAGVYNFNQMSGNYTNPTIISQLNNFNTNGYDLAAVDASNGIITQIQFPTLDAKFSGDEAVNSAELKLNIDYTSNLADTLSLPTSLFLAEAFRRNSNGTKTGALIGIDGSNLIVKDNDRNYDRTAVGFRQRISQGVYTYKFYLPNYVERVKNGLISNPTLYITAAGRGENLRGFTFDSSKDLELNIKYSKTN